MSEPQTSALVRAREAKGLPRYKAASKIDVTDRTLATWESGLRSPSLDKVKQLAVLYGVDLNELGDWDSTLIPQVS
jgi:transcriptional regulator with XRE-family HTH domain